MSARIKLSVVAAGAFLLFASMTQAQIIAYDTPIQGGNQGYGGNLGIDFDVNSPILVTSLGVFDSLADGITGPIQVGIFNRDTTALVGTTCTFTTATNASTTRINSNQFCTAASHGFAGFLLPIGHYSVVARGFSDADKDGNGTLVPFTPST